MGLLASATRASMSSGCPHHTPCLLVDGPPVDCHVSSGQRLRRGWCGCQSSWPRLTEGPRVSPHWSQAVRPVSLSPPPSPSHTANGSALVSSLPLQFFACLVMIAYGVSAFFSFQAWRGAGSNAATSQMAGGYA